MAESENKYRKSIEANGKLFDKEITPEALSYISSHKDEIEKNIKNFKEESEGEDEDKARFASKLLSKMGFSADERVEMWRDTGRDLTIMMGVVSKIVEPYESGKLPKEERLEKIFASEEKESEKDPRDLMSKSEIELSDYLSMDKGEDRNDLVKGFLANRGGEISADLRRRAINSLSEKSEGGQVIKTLGESGNKLNTETKPSRVTDDEFNVLLRECMNTVFFSPDTNMNTNSVIRSLSSDGGVWTSLKGSNVPLDYETRERLVNSGIEAWIGVRKTMDGWQTFKNADELTSKDIRNNAIFLSEEIISKLAGMNEVPLLKGPDYLNSEKTNVGKEVSEAMKKLYDYFNGNGDPKNAKDHWGMIDYSLAQKAEIYDQLGINRYVGEAAFVTLLSGLMLVNSEGSKLDTFRALLNTSGKRVADYKVSPERDPFVRMLVQEKTINGKKPNVDKKYVSELEKDIKRMLPDKLIPTGLSGGGEDALNKGNWLDWAANNIEVGKRAGNIIPRSTEVLKQRALASNAMDIIDLTKAAMKPDASIDDLAKLKGKLYAAFSAYKEYGWVDKDGNIVEDFRVGDGDNKQDMANWVSKIMLSSSKSFLYTHSLLDHTNQKPLNMYDLLNVAKKIYSKDKSKGYNFVGLGKNAYSERKDIKRFIKKLGKNVFKIVFRPSDKRIPKWYLGTYLSSDQRAVCLASERAKKNWFWSWI